MKNELGSQRVAIITGGSRGLGEALALQLRDEGYRIVEFSRTAPHSFSYQLDLSDSSKVEERVRSALSSIDPTCCSELVIVNNAGTLAPIGPAWLKPTNEVAANISINFSSAIIVLNQIISHFRKAPYRKVIVNVSSGAALKGYAGWSLYCASKAGMEGFIRALAVEERLQEHPFLAISVDPGVIDTEMQASIRAASVTDFPDVERFIRRKNEGGLSSPPSVAGAILRIVSSPELVPGQRYEAVGTR